MTNVTKYCANCGVELETNVRFCANCGTPAASTVPEQLNNTPATDSASSMSLPSVAGGNAIIQPSNPPKNPGIAALLSFFLAGGAGQIYLGQTVKGIVLILLTLFTVWVFGTGFLVWIIGAIDAYVIGERLKSGRTVKEWEFFWN